MANTTVQDPITTKTGQNKSATTRKNRQAQGNTAAKGGPSEASNRRFMIILYAVLAIGVLLIGGLVYAVLQM